MNLGLPSDLTWYKLLTDWGSLIGGVLALIAGGIAYIGARQAAAKQIAAANNKDRMQARGIVVGIFPELLAIEVSYEKASKVIDERLLLLKNGLVLAIGPTIRSAKLDIPPLLSRNIDNLYLIQPGGHSLLQLVSFALQYNDLVETLARQIEQGTIGFDPTRHQKDLSGHLKAISIVLADANREIDPLHREATG